MATSSEHCAFVLLAEFDIDRGAQLTYQFPQPLGTDEGLLANLMLPDGAERQLEDWTIFFLNQTPFNQIAPVLALEDTPSTGPDESTGELLYVLNLVRTKHDSSKRRGAEVKAMAICTRHSFMQIFKPVLLMALDDYFANPSQECLTRLFDAINAMDISHAPSLTRDEKLIMRITERKDLFMEKFTPIQNIPLSNASTTSVNKRPSQGNAHVSHKDTVMMLSGASESSSSVEGPKPRSQHTSRSRADSLKSHQSESEGQRGRRSIDSASTSSHIRAGRDGRDDTSIPAVPVLDASSRMPKDTHFYQTSIVYSGHTLPIKMPLSTFPEEVGDYSLITLITTFTPPNTVISGPSHPHLHTNGPLTNPIILLFNALITGKRIIFLGYQRPAGQVASVVLAACALGSGCGAILRGFIARAFPYATLTNREEWENVPGYIAGVTNPIFEQAGAWDVLCDIGNGRIVVHRDIHISCPVQPLPVVGAPGSILVRTGTLRGEAPPGIVGEEEAGRSSSQINVHGKVDAGGRADSMDNIFMEDIVSAISYHFGESLVRARFTEYVLRFVRLVARYEEDYLGSTKSGFPTSSFMISVDGHTHLGSGLIFTDEMSAAKELAINANRIEGWRRTKMYEYYCQDFQNAVATKAIQGFDLTHQLVRLKTVKNLHDAEVELIMRTLVENVQTYDQVVELLALLPQYLGGLLPITFGLFHQQESIRNYTVDLLTVLRSFPIGVHFLQGLNHFHRYSFVRQAHSREAKLFRDQNALLSPPISNMTSWTPSNRSESSLGNGS